jgi:hypothetical protein
MTRWRLLILGLVAGLAGTLVSAQAAEDPLPGALKKASAEGKYRMLLRQIKVPADEKEHGAFEDLGRQARREYAGFADLPEGYWVYAAPYWYVWRDRSDSPGAYRPWGPEQVAGPPNTWPRSGDLTTAWASLSPDGQDEWLLLEYPEAVRPSAVLVYATFNPGAVGRVCVFKPDGTEVEVWKGQDPTPVGSGKGVSVIPFRTAFPVTRVKIYLRSKDVGGWNEIDAVGLRVGRRTVWARSAEASTTYASLAAPAVVPVVAPPSRIDKLEREVIDLRERLRWLEERLRMKKAKKEGATP